ncbi:MAG: ral substrate transporter [Pseudonocardia sp.]|nr:ral substrate transporter [Pseudonocardia sp.]
MPGHQPRGSRTRRRKRRVRSQEPIVMNEAVVRRTVLATAMGNAMEWYDFGIYSYLAVVLGRVFFPNTGGSGLLYSFTAFAVAFVVRPIGGVLLGLLGDRVGRKRILTATILMMAVATFSIGLIPSYDSIGIWAPILLFVARLVQGLSAGGEYSGASTFISESSPDRRRGFLASFLEFGTVTGFVLGAGLVTGLTAALGDATMQQWGWRVPFLLAGPLGLIGVWLRLRIAETPAFERTESAERQRSARSRFRDVVVQQRRALLLAIAVVLALDVTNYLVLSYLPNYLSGTLGYDTTHSLLLTVVTMLAMLGAIPFVGRLADRVGRRPVLAAACLGYLVLSVPALWLLQHGSGSATLAGLLLLGLCQTLFIGTTPAALPEMFPTSHRYSGMALAFNIAASLFGGTAPMVAEYLVRTTGNLYTPAYYMMAAGLVGLVAVWIMRETAQQPLQGSPPTISESDSSDGRSVPG